MISELISRQVAIDALKAIKQGLWEIDIPSPTVPEYVEHHEQIKRMMEITDGWINRLMEEPPAQQWTTCAEKLPDYGQRVLGTFKVTYGNICRTTQRITLHGNDVWTAGLGDDPIAWCEIPEPYEGG